MSFREGSDTTIKFYKGPDVLSSIEVDLSVEDNHVLGIMTLI